MLIGTRVTLLMAFLVAAIAALIGVIVGVCSGYFAGTFDLVTQRFVEFMGAFPDLPLLGPSSTFAEEAAPCSCSSCLQEF